MSMNFADAASRLKKKREEDLPPVVNRDYGEIHLLRARILGVMIRDARQANGATQSEVSEQLGISENELRTWEYGEAAPTLPQLEMLAYYLDVPLSQFWAEKTLDKAQEERSIPVAKDEYAALRDRIIGAKLSLARQGAKLSREELGQKSGLTPEQVEAYETGAAISYPELASLASAVNKSITYFIEDSGRVGSWLRLQEEYHRFTELEDSMRAFVVQPVNAPYIEIAMRLAGMPLGELRTVAEKILDITL